MSKKVLIIGLDGATWEVLDPLIEKGKMPNLARLKTEGVSGVLLSTIPPVTAPAWASFQTGVNPGRHGIFDFSVFDLQNRELDLVDSTFLKGETIWEKAARAGKKVITINIPLTYPPKEVLGWIQVGGPLSGTTSPRCVYPEEIYEEVQRFDYEIASSGLEVRGRHPLPEAVDRFIEIEEKRYALAKHFLKNKEWDLFMVHNQTMDTVQHAFYHYLDWENTEVRKERNEVVRFYEFVDKEIGELVELAEEEATIFIVSDHGFKRVKRVINLNILLAREGYLSFSPRFFLKKIIELIRKLDFFNLEAKIIEGLVLRHKNLRGKIFSFGNNFIDWDRTRAYMGPGSIYGNVYLLDKSLRYRVRSILEELTDPATGQRVIDEIWEKEKVYDGPFVDKLPDFILKPAEEYAFKTNFLLRETKLFRAVNSKKEEAGTHAREGMFVLQEPSSGKKSFQEVGIKDMASHILECLDLSAAEDANEKGLNLSPNCI